MTVIPNESELLLVQDARGINLRYRTQLKLLPFVLLSFSWLVMPSHLFKHVSCSHVFLRCASHSAFHLRLLSFAHTVLIVASVLVVSMVGRRGKRKKRYPHRSIIFLLSHRSVLTLSTFVLAGPVVRCPHRCQLFASLCRCSST